MSSRHSTRGALGGADLRRTCRAQMAVVVAVLERREAVNVGARIDVARRIDARMLRASDTLDDVWAATDAGLRHEDGCGGHGTNCSEHAAQVRAIFRRWGRAVEL